MKIKKIVLYLSIFVAMAVILLINTFYINPKVVTVNKQTFKSNKISSKFNDFTIVFLSDIHYGTAIKEEDLARLSELINNFDPDLILFSGDLFDNISSYTFDSGERDELIRQLQNMQANYGKFAVLGNHDLSSETVKEMTLDILNAGDFEVLDNTNTKIYIGNDYINLVGIESLAGGSPDINKAYSDVDNQHLTISLCHTPDIFDELPLSSTDLVLAGHSHGGQIYLPLINNFYRPVYAEKYFKGFYLKDNTSLYVTNGVGTTRINARLLSDSEIVVFKLSDSYNSQSLQ